MLSPRKPAERGSDSLLPGSDLLESSWMTMNLEVFPVLPAPAAQDGSEITMVRLIALIQTDCAIVEVDATVRRQRFPFLQMEQHRRVGRRSTLHALERGREAARGTENFWMTKQGSESSHRGMTRSSDPTCRRRVQQPEAIGKSGNDHNRIDGIGGGGARRALPPRSFPEEFPRHEAWQSLPGPSTPGSASAAWEISE